MNGRTPDPVAPRELLLDGLWRENPALVKLLGLCPLLAVSTTVLNAVALGLATALTLLVSSTLVSALREQIQAPVRLPVYVLIIASSVTIIELLLQAWSPGLYDSLGIFLPLIVTNCLILGRAEAFAAHQRVPVAALDALAMGAGFTAVLVCLGAMRELLGHGALLSDAAALFGSSQAHRSMTLFPAEYGILLALLPPGAFILLGILLAVRQNLLARRTGNQRNTRTHT